MVIEKILNNNVVITRDEQQNEVIAMGRGLAFQKKIGEKIEADKVDKIYRLADNAISQKFQELLAELPLEYLNTTDELINYAKQQLNTELNESIYISLTDHIHTAIVRQKKGIVVKNALLWDIKRFYPKEFQIGVKALEKIEAEYGLRLPEDEAGFIALHLVNAQAENDSLNDTYELTKIMQDIMNIVKYYFKTSFNEDSVYFYRFTTHLRFFIMRMLSNSPHSGESDEDLLELVKIKYRNSFECVNRIDEFLKEKYYYEMTDDERLYLTIHIARLMEKG
ncbi:BglG family transcription antiterminator LicT [Enterococcus sp. LJL120]